MKDGGSFRLALVTAPDLKTARRLAKLILESRAAACANLFPGLESHYWWKGKLESSAEVLIIFKTTKQRLAKLEKMIVKNHPYDTPEFIVLPLSGGSKKYLKWLGDSVR